jgi:hypothetical protein
MTGDEIKIVKVYKVFHMGVSSAQPMDEPDGTQLYDWLRTRGYSEQETAHIIPQIEERGEISIRLPRIDL